jgi:hypothetical protein
MAKQKRRKVEPMGPGYEGAVIIDASVRLSATRWESRALRCRPGTFEWRYGRKNADTALYHAGIKLADLWERAGTAAAASPDLRRSGSSQWKNLPDVRAEAMDEIDAAREHIGKAGMSLLVDYCVMGTPASDIAGKYDMGERAMSHVLEHHLACAAVHFRFK